MISFENKTIVCVHVNVMYQQPFTDVDLLDHTTIQHTEEVIYTPDEIVLDVEEVQAALNQEGYALKRNYVTPADE